MRASRLLLVAALGSLFAVAPLACSDDAGTKPGDIQCDDGVDNDGNGLKDLNDPSCDDAFDLTEDGIISPQCDDGEDNDGDGKTDFPNDPGCFIDRQDSEEDECPDGVTCPQCANGIDDDMNGSTDFPADNGGCTAAADVEEYTRNPIACGPGIIIDKLLFTGKATGTLMAGAASNLRSPMCGGAGAEDVYEVRVTVPKVVVATTDTDGTVADTVVYIRSEMCSMDASEVKCNDNIDTVEKSSTVTAALQPGTYYIVVDSKDAVGGAYELSVNFFIGEGTQCFGPGDCGPGLICRVPKGGSTKICAKHVCEDNVDEDNDTKNGFPDDPGCSSLIDDDESDTCPGVSSGCPECGDGVDNDVDGKIDFGNNGDTTCSSASSATESCVSTEGVTALTTAATMGTTVGAVNDVQLPFGSPNYCQSSSSTAPDKTYRLDVPAMNSLSITNTQTWDGSVGLYPSSCTGAPIACDDEPEGLTLGALAAGTYYYVVDGYSSGTGAFTINVSGSMAPNASCESPLAQAGAITCSLGYACQGNVGSRTCQPAVCSDTSDNDNDMKADFPLDPGCDGPADTSEADPASAPVCANGMDDDMDTLTDYPADFGCASASSATEAFCTGEIASDMPGKITAKVTTGTTAAKANNWQPACASSTAPDVAFSLQLPVPVTTLQVDTIGSGYDTILMVRSLDCATALFCDDEGGGTNNSSKIVMNGVAPGGYAIVVDGWLSYSGTFNLNVFGTVGPNTRCDSPLFSGGANAVLTCPAGTTCTGNPIPKCQ